jgi:hypothetical protein
MKMATEQNNKNTIKSVNNKGRLIRNISKWYRDTIDVKNPKIKRDLSLTDLQKIAENNKEFAKWLYTNLAEGKLPQKLSLKKMNDEQILNISNILNIQQSSEEDVEDYLNLIVDIYQKHLNENNIQKKVTSSKLRIYEVIFFIAKDLNKPVDVTVIVKNINDFSWSIKHLDFKNAKYLADLISTK